MDLMIAILIMLVFGCLAFWRSAKWFAKHSRWPSPIVSFAVLVALAFVFLLKDRLFLARLFPFSPAIIVTNIAPVLLAVGAAAALKMADRPPWRRRGLAGLLGAFALIALLQPVLQRHFRPVKTGENTVWYSNGVCQQSSTVTCSPAAAVTLLKAHGVEKTERQLVDACLTDRNGTATLGLWRGLCIATRDCKWKPAILNADLNDLLGKTDREDVFPCLVLVGFPRFAEPDPVYNEQYGWPPGFRHSVVIYGPHPDGGVDVGDPSVGRERWSERDLEVLWRGEGIRLTK